MDAPARALRPGLATTVLCGVVVLVGWAFFAGGASGSGATAALGSVAVLLATLVLVGWSRASVGLPRLDRYGAAAAAAATGLVAWIGLSVWWSIAGDRSWDALAKGIVLLAFGVVGLAAGALPVRPLRSLAVVLAGALGVVLAWALVGKAIPAIGPEDAGRVARLKGSIGYWNALALLADAALGLGLWLAASLGGAGIRFARPAGAVLLYAAGLVLLLTQSRAGLIAGLAVVAFVLWQSMNRLEAALLGVLSLTPALVVVGWAFTRPALVDAGGARSDRVSDGAVFGVLAVVGAVVVLVLVSKVPVSRLLADHSRGVLRSLVGAIVLVVVVGLSGLVLSVGNPFTWAVDQVGGSGEVVNDPGRFGSLETNNRTAWWGEAWRIFVDNPAGGTGAHTFEIARKRVRTDARNVTEPHSVPLQLLADTGVPGVLLGLVLVGGVLLGVRGTLARLESTERAAAVALVALPLAYGLHALVDYDLDFLAVSAPTTLAAASLLAAGRPLATPPRGKVFALCAVVGALSLISVVVAPALSTRAVESSLGKADDRDLEGAAVAARRAQRLNPLSPEPLYARATIAELAGDTRGAAELYDQATRLQPENPATWFQLGLFRYIGGDLCGAYHALNAAYTLDPKSSLFSPKSAFDRAKAAVNDPEDPACGR